MRKNNYFLNMTTPSNHIFLQRNILHNYNVAKNNKAKEEFSKIVPANMPMQLDSHGKIMLGMLKHIAISTFSFLLFR